MENDSVNTCTLKSVNYFHFQAMPGVIHVVESCFKLSSYSSSGSKRLDRSSPFTWDGIGTKVLVVNVLHFLCL